jgi:hypothetical protein
MKYIFIIVNFSKMIIIYEEREREKQVSIFKNVSKLFTQKYFKFQKLDSIRYWILI